MKRWIALLLAGLALWQLPAQAQPRQYNQAELDALLAPIALYPDSVLSHVLVASTQPQEIREAAAWSRANPHLAGEAAVQAAEPLPWHPSVKALLAFPDLLHRMDESPQWSADLGHAFLEQEPYVMDTVQSLRRRAQASGALQSDSNYTVQQSGSSIEVYPAHPGTVYVPYYDPYVVYGSWWWPAYRPVFWRPWHARPVHFGHAHFFHTHFVVRHVDWHRRHVVRNVVHHPSHRPVHRAAPARQHVHPRPIVGNPVTIQSHPQPVRPLIDSVRIQAQRAPQPARVHQQPRFEQRRSEHRPAPSPQQVHPRPIVGSPVTIQSHPQPVRPLIDSVRIRAQSVPQPARVHQQPRFEQRRAEPRREHRPSGRQESRGNHNRRG